MMSQSSTSSIIRCHTCLPLSFAILIACAIPVALIVFVLLFIRSRIQGKGFMRSVEASLLTLALFGGVIAVLIYSTGLAFPEVDMTHTAFTQTNVDASTGAQVHFVNPSNGMEQIFCITSKTMPSMNMTIHVQDNSGFAS